MNKKFYMVSYKISIKYGAAGSRVHQVIHILLLSLLIVTRFVVR